ncbi:hypothetical protein, partial [Pedobacter sp.]
IKGISAKPKITVKKPAPAKSTNTKNKTPKPAVKTPAKNLAKERSKPVTPPTDAQVRMPKSVNDSLKTDTLKQQD